jgi:hypothetical protein
MYIVGPSVGIATGQSELWTAMLLTSSGRRCERYMGHDKEYIDTGMGGAKAPSVSVTESDGDIPLGAEGSKYRLECCWPVTDVERGRC